MTAHKHPFALHYPHADNGIPNDPTPKDQAVYVPSVTPSFAIAAYQGKWNRPLPAGLPDGALNFLDPANSDFFRISHVMSSAGQALRQTRDCIITKRDRVATRLIADSGGYQIAKGRAHLDPVRDRLAILRWMERHADYAMTLDVPTGPVLKRGYRYKSTAECLSATLDHLNFFSDNRASKELKLLNVLQGNDADEADAWYDAVKSYEFEGWAFAGKLRHNIYHLLRRILIMAKENRLQDKAWVHVLGTCELETAVLLTALQRSINRHINPNLRISFDTSSPFRLIATKQIYTIPNLSNQRMTMPSRRAPDHVDYIDCDLPWPWPSPLGNLMTMADICVSRPVTARGYHDTLSHYLMIHHNLAALCWAVALTNRVFDVEQKSHEHTIVSHVGAAVEAIEYVIASGSLHQLACYQHTFSATRHGDIYGEDSGDDDRVDF